MITQEQINSIIFVLKPLDLVPPGKPERFATLISPGRRYNNASSIKPFVIGGVKFCKWCTKEEIFGRNQYCSDICRKSCYTYLKPQSETGRVHLLLRQNLACASCGYSWADIFQGYLNRKMDDGEPYSFHRLGYMINAFSMEQGRPRGLQIDHIIPVSQGGDTFGFDNCQALCEPCHKKKTLDDRREYANTKKDS